MRVYRKRYGNSPNGKGNAIFWLMLIFLPVVGWIFGLANFIIEHFIEVIIYGTIALVIISIICIKIMDKNEEDDKEC